MSQPAVRSAKVEPRVVKTTSNNISSGTKAGPAANDNYRGVQNAQVDQRRKSPVAANDNVPRRSVIYPKEFNQNPYSSIPSTDESFREKQIQNAQLQTARVGKGDNKSSSRMRRLNNEALNAVAFQQQGASSPVTKASAAVARAAVSLKNKLAVIGVMWSPAIGILWVFCLVMFMFTIFGMALNNMTEDSWLWKVVPGFITGSVDDFIKVIFLIGWGGGIFGGVMTIMIVAMQLLFGGVWNSFRGMCIFGLLIATALYFVPFLQIIPWVYLWLIIILFIPNKKA